MPSMNIDQLNFVCKQSTRNAFDEFKRQIEFALFPLDETLKITLQAHMLEQIRQGVVKTIFKENTLLKSDCKALNDTLNQYGLLALKVSNNYSKKYL
jgi:hypothetical protein